MNFDFEKNLDFTKVHESFYRLCEAEKALKKARRRARVVRTIEKTVMIVGAVSIYKAVKNHEAK